ncbi:MAG: hypothetical protein ABIH88_00340 [Patescibacteria group bacterium]|nr:hypothetical protein [Patescibacteria group bacterium]
MKKIAFVLASVLFVLIIANLIFLDIGFFKEERKSIQAPTAIESPQAEKVDKAYCSQVCQDLIDEKIEKAISNIPEKTSEIVEKTSIIEKTSQASTQTISYIPISGGLSSQNRDWVDVGSSSFYLDTADYPSLNKAYFIAVIKTEYGQGRVFARLYDATHSIGVQGSEVSSDNENFEMKESGTLSFWKGKNLYKVQIKSLNGYSAFFDSGRIKLYLK